VSNSYLNQVVNAVREIAKEVTPAAYRENTVVAALVTQQNRMESALQVMEASYSQFSQSLAQQAQTLQRQEQTSLEVLQLRSTVAEQQRGIQQALTLPHQAATGEPRSWRATSSRMVPCK
jgi:DNA-binding transcriptional regulator YdaS (Cro superfamily)